MSTIWRLKTSIIKIPILFVTPHGFETQQSTRGYKYGAQYTIARCQHTVTVVITAPLPHKGLITSGDIGWLPYTMMAHGEMDSLIPVRSCPRSMTEHYKTMTLDAMDDLGSAMVFRNASQSLAFIGPDKSITANYAPHRAISDMLIMMMALSMIEKFVQRISTVVKQRASYGQQQLENNAQDNSSV